MRQTITRCGLAFLALGMSLTAAQAQDYPTRLIRMIVPFPPGGGVDVAARIIGQKLGDILGQRIVIESRPGASGTIGAQAVAKAAPDGYTILLCPGDFITIPSLMPQMTFDPNKELLPIAMVSSNPLLVVAAANAPFSTVTELLEAARASPNGFAYATPGVASSNHVVGEWIAEAARIKLLHIPYRGGPEAALAVAAGDVPLGIVSPPAVYPGLVNGGKVKVIALTGTQRPSFLPTSWPTLADNGLPIDATLWLGLFFPAGTPRAIVSRVDEAVGLVLRDGGIRKRMKETGTNPQHVGQAAFIERIHADTARYEEIIRKAGIKIKP